MRSSLQNEPVLKGQLRAKLLQRQQQLELKFWLAAKNFFPQAHPDNGFIVIFGLYQQVDKWRRKRTAAHLNSGQNLRLSTWYTLIHRPRVIFLGQIRIAGACYDATCIIRHDYIGDTLRRIVSRLYSCRRIQTCCQKCCPYSRFPSCSSFFASWRSFSRTDSIFFWYCFNWSRCFFSFCKKNRKLGLL